MSSLRNALPRKAHKERSQPHSRRKFGLLEKHKDYVERARAFHKKEETLQKLKEKAAFKNPDEFYFKMIKSKTVRGVHRTEGEANKYTNEELMLMKTQDIGYILQKLQSEKKKIEKLNAVLHSVDNPSSSQHIYFAEDSYMETRLQCDSDYTNIVKTKVCGNCCFKFSETKSTIFLDCDAASCTNYEVALDACSHPIMEFRKTEAREIRAQASEKRENHSFEGLPKDIKRKTIASYRELEARRSRVKELEKIYMDMAMQKELQKKGRKRKLREDEIVSPTSGPVYKWRQERKR